MDTPIYQQTVDETLIDPFPPPHQGRHVLMGNPDPNEPQSETAGEENHEDPWVYAEDGEVGPPENPTDIESEIP